MADIEEKGDRRLPQQEKGALQGQPDARAARNAGRQELKAAEEIRTNQSDGSLRKYAGLAEQELSIELCYEGRVASRTQKVSERELLAQVPKELIAEQSRTLEALETAAKTNPVADVALRFRRQADAMEPGQDKDRLTKLAKEQAAEILAPRVNNDQEDCGVHEVPRALTAPLSGQLQYPDKEVEGVKRLTQEDIRKLARAFEVAGPAAEASINETSGEILRRTGESYRDTVLCGVNAVVGLLEYDRDLLINPAKAREKAGEAGEVLGLLMYHGAVLSIKTAGYAETVRQSGDYSLPLKHIPQMLNKWYESQSPADQMAIVASVTGGLHLNQSIGEVQKLRKPGAFSAFLQESIDMLPRNPEAESRAMELMGALVKRAEPVKQAVGLGAVAEKDYTFAMSKADDLGGFGKGRAGEPLHERDIVNPIDRTATAEGKVAQLMALTEENKPLVQKFLKAVDTKFGTKSEMSVKEPQDILDKANRPSIKEKKDWFDVEHVRDSFRFKTPVENLNDLPNIVKQLKESGFEIVKLDLDKLIKPKGRGWRMAAIDLRAPNGQIMEYQILPREMNEAGKIEHRMYKQWRGKDVSTMSMEEKKQSLKADVEARKLYKMAWYSYLSRTRQSEQDVHKLIEQAY